MRFRYSLGLTFVTGLVLLCGCNNNHLRAPSTLIYTTPAAVYTKGVQIASNTPTASGGAVASYSVTPALPAGLSLNTTTGIVSGTPTAVAATAGYMVTATNASGSTSASLSITVNDQPPSALSYSTGTAVYTKGVQITPNLPTNSGGTVISYNVTPALPPGLTLNALSGIIIGSPTVVTAATNYTVTATNSGGNTTAVLNITVMAPPPSAPQAIPNLGQLITPTAPYDSSFEPLVPGAAVLPQYPDWQVGQAVTTVVSPDGKTLLILTSGYNRIFNPLNPLNISSSGYNNGSAYNLDHTAFDYLNSEEYVFIYDISQGAPVQKQVVTIPNSYNGITFDPSGTAFYVSGGMGDYPFAKGSPNGLDIVAPSLTFATDFQGNGDNVHVFALDPVKLTWAEQPELLMNHPAGLGLAVVNTGPATANGAIFESPCAAGVAISSDGQTLAVANYDNDSISVFTGGLGHWTRMPDIDLRPGVGDPTKTGIPGGEYPFWVVIQGTGENTTAYVSSIRDREIDVVSLGSTMKVTGRIPVVGEPIKMTMNKAQTRLYVAEDMSDTIDDIDISSTSAKNGTTPILETIKVAATPALLAAYPPLSNYRGANTNSVTLSPDESQLYVTNGNLNAVAVVQLAGVDKNDQTIGLIPTGWYPNSVSFGPTVNSPNGHWVYVVNGKSPTGPNPGMCYSAAPPPQAGGHKNCMWSQGYNPQRVKAGFQSFPQPTAAQLATLTAQVAINGHFSATESNSDATVMAAVRSGIQHVIYIIKENRGYDQILGDLEVGNGDPTLTEFGQAITPNQHQLARTFVTLDNMMASSEVSNDGWPWSTSARAPDVIERQSLPFYANRGLSLDYDGLNRNVNVAIPTVAGRMAADPLTPSDPNLLPLTANTAAPDGPDGPKGDGDVAYQGEGYLWDAANRAGLTIRDYGFFVDPTLYACPAPTGATCIPLVISPSAATPPLVVAYSQNVTLSQYTDPYFRGFDNQFPDYYRYQEWLREFNANYSAGGLPALSLVRLMHDHTGSFGDPGKFLVNTPELQQSDNDYAVGMLIQTIANSSVYAQNTLIFVIEDDSQDSGDHVDSHRTIAFVAGAYVKQGVLVSTPYNTINFVRTMEEVLGLPPMNLNDALSQPMADIFNTYPTKWSFTATVPAGLYSTSLPLTAPAGLVVPKSTHTAEYWARATKGMDFTSEDRMDFAEYNHILWKGLMGNRPYPSRPSGKDLRQNRDQLLARYQRSLQHKAALAAKPVKD
jgi:hypothetical protein